MFTKHFIVARTFFKTFSILNIKTHVVFAVESLYKACFHYTVRCWSSDIYIMLNHNALVQKKDYFGKEKQMQHILSILSEILFTHLLTQQ